MLACDFSPAKVIKRLKKIGLTLLIVLVVLGTAVFLILESHAVQTWLGQRAAAWLSKELGAEVKVERLEIKFFSKLVLREVLVRDQPGDTLIHFGALETGRFKWDRHERVLDLADIRLVRPTFYLKINEGDSITNMTFIEDYFSSDKPDTTASKPFTLRVNQLDITDGTFHYNDWNYPPPAGLVDFDHIELTGFQLNAHDFVLNDDSLWFDVKHLRFKERCGFDLEHLSGHGVISDSLIGFSHMDLQTPRTHLKGEVNFEFGNWKEWKDFSNLVVMNHTLVDSELHWEDLAFFTEEFVGLDRKLYLSGDFRGRLNRLRGRNLWVKWDDNSYLMGNVRTEGLPVIRDTYLTIDISELNTTKAEIDRIPLPPFAEGRTISTPDDFARLGNIRIKGNFTGFLHDFVAFAQIRTALGTINTDMQLNENPDGTLRYRGGLSMRDFDLKRFYDEPALGNVSATLELDGTGFELSNIDAKVKGTVHSIKVLNYDYRDSRINARLKNSYFNGSLSLRDPNAFFDFEGKVDLADKDPLLLFTADIQNINLGKLNLVKDKMHYYAMSGHVDWTGRGLTLDSFRGTVEVSDFSFCFDEDDYFVEQLTILAEGSARNKSYTLRSSLADADLNGQFTFPGLADAFIDLAAHLLPPTMVPHLGSAKNQNFAMRLKVKDFSPLTGSVLPQLYFAGGSHIRLNYADSTRRFSGTFFTDSLNVYGQSANRLVVDMQKPEEEVYVTIMADKSRLGGAVTMDNLALDLRAEGDTIYSSLVWDSPGQFHRGDINGLLRIESARRGTFIFLRSDIGIFENQWEILPNARIVSDSTSFALQNVDFVNGDQFIRAAGTVSEQPDSQLFLELNRFDLRNANPVLIEDSLTLGGTVTGKASLSNLYKRPLFTSDLEIDDLAINGHLIGDLCIESQLDQRNERLILYGELEKGVTRPLRFAGFYNIQEELSPLDLVVDMFDFDLDILNSLKMTEIRNFSGKADANIRVTGTVDAPQMDGSVMLKNAGLKVDYLNTFYTITDKLTVRPDMIFADEVKVRDRAGNTAKLTGQFIHDNFSRWSLNVFADMEDRPFTCMNTTEELNPLFFGRVVARGNVNMFLYPGHSEFTVNLRSERGTNLSLPMESGEVTGMADFIVFVDKEKQSITVAERDFSGISLELELDITPDAEIQIIFDKAAGDILKGRGSGHLSMEINTLGKFNMYGQVTVQEGNYMFTLKNLLNKEFEILPGGTINWSGDPLKAEMDISTVYKLSASLADLMSASINAEQYNVRVPVQLVMNLKGQLMSPAIVFDIKLPTVDEFTRSYVRSVLSSEEQMNRQAFALLILMRFVTPIGMEGTASTGPRVNAMANTTEFLTGQLNSWLSQISQDFDVGVNYRPGDEVASSEVALALSTQFFDNRLRLTGNFGVNYGNPNQDNSLIGDFRAEYIIDEYGRLRMVFYNESHQFDPTRLDQRGATQGLGVLYQIEF